MSPSGAPRVRHGQFPRASSAGGCDESTLAAGTLIAAGLGPLSEEVDYMDKPALRLATRGGIIG